MLYCACCVIYGLAVNGDISITSDSHSVIATTLDIIVTTRVDVDLTIPFSDEVDITFVNLYVYVSIGPYLYIVIVIGLASFVYVYLMAAPYTDIRFTYDGDEVVYRGKGMVGAFDNGHTVTLFVHF